jgi:hypothetical protein
MEYLLSERLLTDLSQEPTNNIRNVFKLYRLFAIQMEPYNAAFNITPLGENKCKSYFPLFPLSNRSR